MQPMLQYQLQVAIVLAVSAACSLFAFTVPPQQERRIQLPGDAEEDTPQRDSFNVVTPEDLVDGAPVNGEAFWFRMRMRKLGMSALLATALAMQTIGLGWSLVQDNYEGIAVHTCHTIFVLYTFLVAARSVTQEDRKHEQSVIHLFALTCIATALLFATSILPPTTLADVRIAVSSSVPLGLWCSTLGLYTLCFVTAITTPCGPPLHFPPGNIYSGKMLMKVTTTSKDNVCGVTGASIWDALLFSYTTKVIMLGNSPESLEIADLPIVSVDMRAAKNFATMRSAVRRWTLRIGSWRPSPGSGWQLGYTLLRVNAGLLIAVALLASITAVLFYTPAYFLQHVIHYLEVDPDRTDRAWGWLYCAGLFISNAIVYILTGQLGSLSTTTLQVRMRVQLNSILFAKTLVRKSIAAASGPVSSATGSDAVANGTAEEDEGAKESTEEDGFSSKAQIMTLMTTDVDRVSDVAWRFSTLIDSPIELIIGTMFLYHLLGVSCFFGLAATCLFLPLNHFASKVVVHAQEQLMKARDERVGLMNEILGGIRMLKFMAWERCFEARVMEIRSRELRYQRLNYHIEALFNAIWSASPILVTLVSFWHFTVIRQQPLTPSIAFTSISVFNEMKFALNALPETFINMLQSIVSMRRIEKYLHSREVQPVEPLDGRPRPIILRNVTATWPQDEIRRPKTQPLVAFTPKHKFVLMDLNLNFPLGELSLICGKLGSGKSLLLLSMLGEADILAGQLSCPRSPPDTIASISGVVLPEESWIVHGACAYVPQSAWLRNASIRDNILFDLPYVEERYQKTLEVCALFSDLEILEDGDMSEIGERGVNLSGGQKARVSLARAVYSRASVLLLDDVLSAVDAHTARHLYYDCLKGTLMHDRTVILVSHHVQLCASGASYIVALDSGRVIYHGDRENFTSSTVLSTLAHSGATDYSDVAEDAATINVENLSDKNQADSSRESCSETNLSDVFAAPHLETKAHQKAPRKLIEEEKRAVGRVSKTVWMTYIAACGGYVYWTLFGLALALAALSPVAENGWLRIWTGATLEEETNSPLFYISIYAAITATGVVFATLRWFFLYHGGMHASTMLYQGLLEGVLFADIRFHDTVSRGRLLNRFGKDFEGIDSSLPDNFGRSIAYCLSVLTTFITITYVGGVPFLIATVIFATLYYSVAKVYGQTSRNMRRLESVARSPLYTMYGETITGVTVLRAFGASTVVMREMLRRIDTSVNPYYWRWGVNRWVSVRFSLLSSAVVGVTAFVAVMTAGISASLAGFALAFASTILNDLFLLVRRFVGLEQSMIAVERIKEFSDLPREPPETIEPRPPASWPQQGVIVCEHLVIRYAPDLPDVLHDLNFTIRPREKIGVIGRTGSGKSTLALSFFRFVEPTDGRIMIDGLDISTIGLRDLRSRLTIIPQDPTIMSGTLRSTLDVFNQYDDAEMYEALRRVHLIPAADGSDEDDEIINTNIFRNLDSPVSEGGENFSTGEKQLLCMARAILKRTKVLLMDEATASVDYATDELIGKTIREEFADSTVLTIAHRLRTIIEYDRVMLLDQGRIAEFDKPATLLADSSSKFYSLCKATGKTEFSILKKIVGVL